MLKAPKAALAFVLVALALMMEGTLDANADSKLPDPVKAGVAEKLFRLDCGRSIANDESVWTPGENVGRRVEFSSTCWLIAKLCNIAQLCDHFRSIFPWGLVHKRGEPCFS